MSTQTPSSLEKFVMGDHTVPITVAELVNARLAGYAYRTIPDNHVLREGLREPRRSLEIRHQLVKHQLKPLLKAWSDAGIRVMLIKGFWLAEFVYERPGDRGYGDIDVLMPEEQTQQAIQMAQDLGWSVVFHRRTSGNLHTHEEAHLVSSNGFVNIDLHRLALQSIQLWGHYHPKRITNNLWNLANKQTWEGTTVWLPNPLDGLILNLLNRARGDFWQRRISDLPDALAVIHHSNISREVFLARAKDLNVTNTANMALQTCDPWRKHINTTPPKSWQRIALNLQTANEIGVYELEQLQFQANRAFNAISGLFTMLPIVLRVKRELKRQPDLYQIFRNLEHKNRAKTTANNAELIRLKRGTLLTFQILGPRQDACVPRSLALYLALNQRNFKVHFVSGVRRVQGKMTGHAWLEWQGRPLENLGDHDAPELFKENFRYPTGTFPTNELPKQMP